MGQQQPHQIGQAGTVNIQRVGLLQKDGQRAGQTDCRVFAEHGDGQRATGQHHKSGDLGRLDYVALFARLLQPFCCRLFGLLGFVLVVGHGALDHRNSAMEVA